MILFVLLLLVVLLLLLFNYESFLINFCFRHIFTFTRLRVDVYITKVSLDFNKLTLNHLQHIFFLYFFSLTPFFVINFVVFYKTETGVLNVTGDLDGIS